MFYSNYPRIVIGGLSGDSGKSMVACGLLASLVERGMNTAAFKKGPDYIDTAWLCLASAISARNLDTYLMGYPTVKRSFLNNAVNNGLNVIEGNRGVFDGGDSRGTHSTAELAKLLQSPVILVVDISKVTRTAAAVVLGCIKLDPQLNIAGIILNKVAGERHASITKNSIEEITGTSVIGLVPKLEDKFHLPSRHLGLITPVEFEKGESLINDLKIIVEDYVDISKIIKIADTAPILEGKDTVHAENKFEEDESEKVKIGYFKDQSFSFYYPENLELLTKAGAELVQISSTSPIEIQELEKLDALYIGGGFPETNIPQISLNRELMISLKSLVEDGLPVYAECGGLMYLANNLEWRGNEYPLTGILPISIKMHNKPQGHGYSEVIVDKENPFFETGTVLKGHEFHYSKIYECDPEVKSSFSVSRGTGCFNKRDGLVYKNVLASYFHIHALATPEWVTGMIKCARKYHDLKKSLSSVELI